MDKTNAKPVTVELIKPHTHAGTPYEPGAILELSARDAQWLISIGAAKATAKPKGE